MAIRKHTHTHTLFAEECDSLAVAVKGVTHTHTHTHTPTYLREDWVRVSSAGCRILPVPLEEQDAKEDREGRGRWPLAKTSDFKGAVKHLASYAGTYWNAGAAKKPWIQTTAELDLAFGMLVFFDALSASSSSPVA